MKNNLWKKQYILLRVQHRGKAWKQTAWQQTAWQQDQGTRDHVSKQNKWEVGNCINSQSTTPPPNDVHPPARTHLWKVLWHPPSNVTSWVSNVQIPDPEGGYFLFKPSHLTPWSPKAHGHIIMQYLFSPASKVLIIFQSQHCLKVQRVSIFAVI